MKKKFLFPKSIFFFLALTILCVAAVFVLLYVAEEDKLIAGAILVILCGVLAFLYYRQVVVPYRNFNKLLRLFAEGYTMKEIVDAKYSLSREFDEAARRIDRCIEASEEADGESRQFELIALQNQINPHFLYNTLDGIRGEALDHGVSTVAEMTEALSVYFRYTISKPDALVTVEDEIANVENYFKIQTFRFGERIGMEIRWEDNNETIARNCKMPKLVLQPLVENAIQHGLEGRIGNGKLTISIDMTKTQLIIKVSDNGVGIKEEELKLLQERLRTAGTKVSGKTGGIALPNVNSRIKMLFGAEYGLAIYSLPPAGTDVEVTLPVIR